VFIYSSCGKWVFPPLLCSFPPTTTFISFPAPDYWAVLLLLPAAMFVYSSCGRWVFPPLLWSFPSLRHSHKLSQSWLLGACSHSRGSLSCPPGLFIYSSWEEFPSLNLWRSVYPTLFPTCLYCFYCLLVSFSFFPGGGHSVQGAMLLWPRVVCGSTTVPRSSPGLCLPKLSGHGDWQPGGPPGFSL
jgi:hypothetical protein